eukprot:INCI6224.5.p1 GENE.INCI6224.5~~INCI6224.5.p1  ORF type:complete len:480 (-),score=79.53 INCI6224.5:263-1678(-)
MASKDHPAGALLPGPKKCPSLAIKYASSLSTVSDPKTGEVWQYRGDICVENAMTGERFREKYLQRRPVLFPFAAAVPASENESEDVETAVAVQKSAAKRFIEKLWEQCRDVSPHTGNREAAGANGTWQRKDISMAQFVTQAAEVMKVSKADCETDVGHDSTGEAELYVFDKAMLLAPKMIQLLGDLGIPEFLPQAEALQAILAQKETAITAGSKLDSPSSSSFEGVSATGPMLPDSNHLLLAVGFEGSGTSLHRHNHSWNILFQGQKLWIAYPPHLIPAGLPSCVADPLQRETMESAMRWAHTELDQLIWKSFVQQDRIRLETPSKVPNSIHALSSNATLQTSDEIPYIFVQNSDEIVYLPQDWHHATINLSGAVLPAQPGCEAETLCFGGATVAVAHVADSLAKQPAHLSDFESKPARSVTDQNHRAKATGIGGLALFRAAARKKAAPQRLKWSPQAKVRNNHRSLHCRL